MRILSIEAANFMRWDFSKVDLPETGVVIVTGKNGHGKSTIIEAVAHAAWGQSVRGAPGWRTGEKGGVELSSPVAIVRRNVTKSGSTKLSWTTEDDGSGNYPTKTKAQTKLEELVGTFDVWQRACVFSSHEVGRFTTATDKSRKELLEELLELERFSSAYKSASNDRNAKRRAVSELESNLRLSEQSVSALDRQVAQAQEAEGELADAEELETLRKRAADLRVEIGELEEGLMLTRESVREVEGRVHAATAKHNAVTADLKRYESLGGVCPTCEQEVDADHTHELLDGTREMLGMLGKDYEYARRRAEEARVLLRSDEQNLEVKRGEYRDLVARGQALKGEVARREKWAGKVAELQAEREAAVVDVARLTEETQRERVKLAELDAVCDVLGLQGARAGILAHALESIQAVANEWLARLGLTGLRVELGSQSKTKSGATNDKISFEVVGAGGGHGYKASSGGERRRIDIAVMLALADVAAGRGVSGDSTLFVDELFDALDDEGVEATVEVLNEIAEDRCVVVISHNAMLVNRLPQAVHLHAQDGQISRVRG